MERIEKLKGKLTKASVDAFLVSDMINLRFLSGFTGSAGSLLITPDEAIIFTDSRYTEQAAQESPGFTIIQTLIETDVIKQTMASLGINTIAFEKDHVTYVIWEKFLKNFKDLNLIGVSGWVEELREIKSETEIECIAKAQEIAQSAFKEVLSSIRAGVKEIDLALELEFKMRKSGSEGVAFPFIVVSGERSSLPHGRPTDKKLKPGEFVTFDFGARYNGYCSDMTRTVVVGPVSDKHRKIYETVLKAQLASLSAVKPGVVGKQVDYAGRKVIEDAGYGKYFGHGMGHGVGLNVHERPSVGRASEDVLRPGMVVTVEPGIYIPGFGGVRIEDLVVVTEDGNRNLTVSEKQLIVV